MMRVAVLRRYPVKSLLGERLDEAELTPAGVEHDRGLAFLDRSTGFVATAKHPRLWRALLTYSATVREGTTVITGPDGGEIEAVDEIFSAALGREVELVAGRPPGASVERPDPEEVLARGLEAVLETPTLEIGQGTTGENFVDYAPIHLITTATLDAVGTDLVRYRPNLVLATPPGTPPFVENGWAGRELEIEGSDGPVVLRVSIPTPRCSVPSLEHGTLPRDPQAVRVPLARNRIDVPGFGVLPCAGAYAEVVTSGTVRVGDGTAVR